MSKLGENFGAAFDDQMQFSLEVLDKYKGEAMPKPRPIKKELEDALAYQMENYIKSGLVRKMEQDEERYGCAQLNLVYNPGERLRVTMDARQINAFFVPPPFKLPNVLSVLADEGEKFYCKLDLSDAFMHVRFTEKFSRWFTFDYKGQVYCW